MLHGPFCARYDDSGADLIATVPMVSIFKFRFSPFPPSFQRSHLPLICYDCIGAYVGSGLSSNGLIFVLDGASCDLKKKLVGLIGEEEALASVDKNGKLVLWA
jgi:hypothetical protein